MHAILLVKFAKIRFLLVLKQKLSHANLPLNASMAHNKEHSRTFIQNLVKSDPVQKPFFDSESLALLLSTGLAPRSFLNLLKHGVRVYDLFRWVWMENVLMVFLSQHICIGKHDIDSLIIFHERAILMLYANSLLLLLLSLPMVLALSAPNVRAYR